LNLLRFATEKLVHWEHRSSRLLLREVEPKDVEPLTAMFQEESARRSILRTQRSAKRMRSVMNSAATHAGNEMRTGYLFVVENLSTREVMGICGVSDAQRGSVGAKLGWHFGEQFSRQGYATEAARAVMGFAFENCHVQRVIGDCFSNNHATRRVFAKLSMHRSRFGQVFDWLLSLRYRELRSIVRYSIQRARWESSGDNTTGADGGIADTAASAGISHSNRPPESTDV